MKQVWQCLHISTRGAHHAEKADYCFNISCNIYVNDHDDISILQKP